MIGQTRLLTELTKLVKRTRADGVSVCAQAGSQQVFRFAHDAIHQNVAQETVTVMVKVIQDERVGVASVDTLEAKRLAQCVRAALDIAKHSPRQDPIPALPARQRTRASSDYALSTAHAGAAECVQKVQRIFRLCRGAGATLAGSLMAGERELAVVNSAGSACYAASTVCGAKLVTMFRTLSGYASGAHHDWSRLHLDELLTRSLRQSLHRREAVSVPLGTYDVILEPEAVAELLEWLGYIGFGAKSMEEHTSFMSGRMGEALMHPDLTITDDGTDAHMLRMPFDYEGTRKRPVALIDRGRAAGIVYDTTYGARFGQPSTGHALPPDEAEGPLPLHLAIAPGRESAGELVRRCARGLWIPRFHYVNGLLNPREALMTGLTREGCFLIEDGKLTTPVRTLRFTQSILEALRQVRGISKERRLVADPSIDAGCKLVPTLHLAGFAFTGSSES